MEKSFVAKVVSIILVLSFGLALNGIAFAEQKDELRVGVPHLPTGLDPTRETSNTAVRITYNMFDTLIFQDPLNNYELKPALAVSWERLSDTVLELKLRSGVKFHNGDELTSADVKYSFERVLEPDSPFVLARSFLSVIDRVETPDPLTVRIVTKKSDPIIEYRMATPWGSWIVPSKYAGKMTQEEFGRNPVGTGPFKLSEFTTSHIVIEEFDGYWGSKPNVSKIIYQYIPEAAPRVTALVNAEVDIIAQVPPDQIPMLERYSDEVDVRGVNLANIHMLVYNDKHPAVSNRKLRQAMNLAIDRQLLSEALWQGKAIVARSHQYPSMGDFYFADRPFPEYNPEKARKLVQESGYKDEPIDYNTHPTYYTNAVPAAEAIVEMWREVGINAQVRITDQPWGKEDRAVNNWSNSMRFPDPLGGLWLLWGEGSSPQRNNLWTPLSQFNQLGNELATILDQERRKEIYKELLDIWEEEAPGTTLYYPIESYGVRKGIKWNPYNDYFMDYREYNLSFE